MTQDKRAEYAEALAATAALWRKADGLTHADAEQLLAAQGLTAEEARGVIEHALAQQWLVEEMVRGKTCLRPGSRALSRL